MNAFATSGSFFAPGPCAAFALAFATMASAICPTWSPFAALPPPILGPSFGSPNLSLMAVICGTVSPDRAPWIFATSSGVGVAPPSMAALTASWTASGVSFAAFAGLTFAAAFGGFATGSFFGFGSGFVFSAFGGFGAFSGFGVPLPFAAGGGTGLPGIFHVVTPPARV